MTIPSGLTEKLRAAERVAVLTGAGVSAESGVPTFREAQTGLWANFRPEELASREGFLRDPKAVWEWYAWRRQKVLSVQPNAGHRALAEMEQRIPLLTVITQNVDGLHQTAGSSGVLELHGNILRTKCFEEETIAASWTDTGGVPPRCPDCGAYLRPDVVWFGEELPQGTFAAAQSAAEDCEIFISAGTSSVVYPAAALPLTARRNGALLVEINVAPTPLTASADYFLEGPSGTAFPALLGALR